MEDLDQEQRANPSPTSPSRKRRSRREIEAWLERYGQSGQTQAAFAAEHGIKVGTLRQWLYRRRPNEAKSEGQLLPVKVVEDRGRVSGILVRFPEGVEVEFVRDVEISDLIQLIGRGGSTGC